MTPAETEHFAALRMHVAHLTNALGVAHMAIEQSLPLTAVVAANGPTVGQVIDLARGESEGTIAELLKDADRDLALLQARADFAQVNDLSAQLAIELATAKQDAVILVAAAGAVTAAKAAATADPEGPPEDEWVALCRAVDALAEALPA